MSERSRETRETAAGFIVQDWERTSRFENIQRLFLHTPLADPDPMRVGTLSLDTFESLIGKPQAQLHPLPHLLQTLHSYGYHYRLDDAAVYAQDEPSKEIFKKCLGTPEIVALKVMGEPYHGYGYLEEALKLSKWDEVTKHRLLVTYFQGRVAFLERQNTENNILQDVIQQANHNAYLAGHFQNQQLEPLSPKDVKKLVGAVVQRECTEPTEKSEPSSIRRLND